VTPARSTPSSTPPPSSSTTPSCPSGTVWNGSSCVGTAPQRPAIDATFGIYPTRVLQDQPQVNTAAYQEELIASIQVANGYAVSNVNMTFNDPRGDVNGQSGESVCMGEGGCAASVPQPQWHYRNNEAAAEFEENWNSFYGFWDTSMGAAGVNHTPDTFPVYATATVTGYGITKTVSLEIPSFELMSSLTYPRVGPAVPIQDISPVVAGVAKGESPGQHAVGVIHGAESDFQQAYNWVLEQLGLESPPASNLP